MGNAVPQNFKNTGKSIKKFNIKIESLKQKNHSQNLTLKANFLYINPLGYQIQQIPQDIQFSKIQQSHKKTIDSSYKQRNSNKSSKKLLQSFASQTFVNFSYNEQINVNWNAFIKMKQKNYQQDYKVLKKIGKGGFGTVNKVKNIYTEVIRAAKIIKKDQLKQNQHKKLLEQLNVMRQLDHPNIIKLYQVYDFNNEYVLILQLSQGGQLYKRIKTKRLTEDQIKIFMVQIIKTLIYLHSRNIIHRDLKPQNMLFENNCSNTLKMIDFGLATKFQPINNQNKQYFLTDRVGTFSYIAPQVIYKKYNQKCDIWSAGVILYFMCTGIMPFRGKNQNQLMNSILRQEINFTNSYWKRYSNQCQDLIKLMLQKKSQLRPSAQQIINHKWFQLNLEKIQKIKQPQQNVQNISNNYLKQSQNSNLMNVSQTSQNQQIIQFLYQNEQKSILDDPIVIGILRNIRKFSFKNPLQAVVNTYIASQLLSKQQRSLLTKIFHEVDSDHNGIVTVQELKLVLQRQKPINRERVQLLKRKIDTNCNDQIQFTQFLVSALHNQEFMKKQYFQKAFAYFDIDHSGKISYEQIVQFLVNDTNEQQIIKIFKQIDQNKDGQIDLDQFIRLFINDTEHLMKFLSPKDQILQSQCQNYQIQKQKQKTSNLLNSSNNDSDIYSKSSILKSKQSNNQQNQINTVNSIIMLNQNLKFSINKNDLILQNRKPNKQLIKSQIQNRRKSALNISTNKSNITNPFFLSSQQINKAKRRQSENYPLK